MKEWRSFSIVAMGVALVLALAFPAFAADSDVKPGPRHGPGAGHHMMEGGSGHHGSGYGGDAGLTDEQKQKIEQERKAFWEGNRELRAKIFQKKLELKAEIAKLQPDPKRAAELQKELSIMEVQLDQKHLEHVLRIKVINPYMGTEREMMRSGGMGHGSMGCGMMGEGMGGGMMGGGKGMHNQ